MILLCCGELNKKHIILLGLQVTWCTKVPRSRAKETTEATHTKKIWQVTKLVALYSRDVVSDSKFRPSCRKSHELEEYSQS